MASYDYSGHQVPERAHFKNQAHPEEDYGYSEDDYRDPAPRGGGFSRIVNFLGATASLALVAGVVLWGYQLIVRDVSGVPVVRAAEGPMRIQPENPGGTPADHQGLAVNTVAAVGSAAAPADRLILAPKPVSLSDEDAPMGQLQAAETEKELEEAKARLADDIRQAAVDGAVAEAEGLTITEPVEIPGLQLASLATPEDEPAIDPADLAAQLPDPELAALPGVRRSLRPQTRPARVISRRATTSSATEDAINAAVKAAVGLDVDPNTLAKGTRLAQVGAYESVDVAQAEWDRLNSRFGEFMNGKQRVIQKTSSGGRTFYRLRVMGFDDLSDSRQFCAALVAQGADCIPVSVR
ncbi:MULTISPECIES: SPOR domain-containing protein [unclassified Ruegeria]|uniref:SPOR domain-containing protein n=1 Tax=unclassified Ruegeria TaxID=2625375 RepID=UPI001488DA36|nr:MULTISPECIES: SPOR domain-containing protein [unclassified Ruegeria]